MAIDSSTIIFSVGGVAVFDVVKPEVVNKTFRMPLELVDRLSKVAQTKKVSVNKLVIQCCEYALENLSDKEKQEQK